jgi:hypothetical protein
MSRYARRRAGLLKKMMTIHQITRSHTKKARFIGVISCTFSMIWWIVLILDLILSFSAARQVAGSFVELPSVNSRQPGVDKVGE